MVRCVLRQMCMCVWMCRSEPLDNDSFQLLRQSFISYIQSEYLYGSAEANASCAPFLSLSHDPSL